MMREEALYAALISHLNTHPDHTLYGLFDGVKYPMLWSDLEEGVLSYDMLFHEERLRADLQSVAPYFVALDFESERGKEQSLALLECYGKNGSLFLSSRLDIDKTLEQMRELFYLYTPSGEKGYMRFYEPKIFIYFLKGPKVAYNKIWMTALVRGERPDGKEGYPKVKGSFLIMGTVKTNKKEASEIIPEDFTLHEYKK